MKEIISFFSNEIFRVVDDEWTTAYLYLEVLNKFSSYKGKYSKQGSSELHPIPVSRFDVKMDDMINDLHILTAKENDNYQNWNRAIFTLYPDNKSEIEYIWDQELQDEVDRLNDELT